MPLTADGVRYILQEGGTILGSSRTNPYKNEGDAEKVVKQMEDFGIDALVAIGGDDTSGRGQATLRRLRGAGRGLPQDHRQRPLGDRHHLRLRHRRLHRHGRHRQAQDHGQEPRADRRGRGDGAARGLDHLGRRPRLRRERHPDPRGRAGPGPDRGHLQRARREGREVGPRRRLARASRSRRTS